MAPTNSGDEHHTMHIRRRASHGVCGQSPGDGDGTAVLCRKGRPDVAETHHHVGVIHAGTQVHRGPDRADDLQ
jgi:hypothetical protein